MLTLVPWVVKCPVQGEPKTEVSSRYPVEPRRSLTADDLAQLELALARIETMLDAVLTGRGA